ncbi:MAG: OmpA family protein [Elusimicrobiota bacterium]
MRNKKLLSIILLLAAVYLIPSPASAAEEIYVYSSTSPKKNRFVPSGYMGDASDIHMSEAIMDTPSGSGRCLQVTYIPRGEEKWAGIYWQNPADNWGDEDGGYDLSGAEKLSFWLKQDEGMRRLSGVKVGGLIGEYSDTAAYTTKPIETGREWKKYEIDLEDLDLSYIAGGFALILNSEDFSHRGGEFYIDEIKYVGDSIEAYNEKAGEDFPRLSLEADRESIFIDRGDEIVFKPFGEHDSGIKSWNIEIFDRRRRGAISFSGEGNPPESIAWDGENAEGSYVRPGTYRAVLRVMDNEGNTNLTEPVAFRVLRRDIDQKELDEEEREAPNKDEKFIINYSFEEVDIQRDSAKEQLKQAANIFKRLNYPLIKIYGYTDKIGSREINQIYSKKRAEKAADYLSREFNISKENMQIKGFGEKNPIAPNDTREGRYKNRRVEIILSASKGE